MRRKLEKRWLTCHNKKLAKLIKNPQLLYIGYTLFLLYFTYLYKGKTFQHHITPLSRESTMVVANKLQWVVGMNSGLDYPKDPNKFISIFLLYHELEFENFCFTLPCHSQLTKQCLNPQVGAHVVSVDPACHHHVFECEKIRAPDAAFGYPFQQSSRTDTLKILQNTF